MTPGVDWQLRGAHAADAPELAALDARVGALGWSLASWHDEMSRTIAVHDAWWEDLSPQTSPQQVAQQAAHQVAARQSQLPLPSPSPSQPSTVPQSPESAELVDGAARTWLVAHAEGIVGFAGAAHVDGVAEVLGVAVDPQWQRRGMARSLLQALVGLSQRLGSTTMMLEVRASNSAARQLYREVGFVEEGRRGRYYADGEDAVIARKSW